MTPNQTLTFLRRLERQLGSSRVRAFFRDQTPKTQNEYSLLRGEVSRLVSRLTISRLTRVTTQLQQHSDEIDKRTAVLKEELDKLASARKILTRLDKVVSIFSRVAVFLL